MFAKNVGGKGVTVAVRLRGNLESIATLKGKTGITAMLRRMLSAEYPGATAEALDRLAGRTHYIDSAGRPLPLFDAALLSRFDDLGFDDVLTPQWPLFDALAPAPLLLFRTAFTDQLPREVLDEMMRRRPDARTLEIGGQGAPTPDRRDDTGEGPHHRAVDELLTLHGLLGPLGLVVAGRASGGCLPDLGGVPGRPGCLR